MKRIFNVIQKEAGKLMLLTVLGGAIVSCDSVLDFHEGPCNYYQVKFAYEYNMKFKNLFSDQVKTVTLYAFDEAGNFVTQQTAEGAQLKEDTTYTMALELDPGNYHFVTWAGLDNQSFAIPVMRQNSSKVTELNVKTNRVTRNDSLLVEHSLSPLWHGENSNEEILSRSVRNNHIIKVPLLKNTNIIRVIIAQGYGTNGAPKLASRAISKSAFNYTLTDNNGYMKYDNSLLSDDKLNYKPYSYNDTIVNSRSWGDPAQDYNATVALISTARLVDSQAPSLNIKINETGTNFLSNFDVNKYLEMYFADIIKKEYPKMTYQEWLDREDIFTITFFAGDALNLIKTVIVINGWKIQLNDFEL